MSLSCRLDSAVIGFDVLKCRLCCAVMMDPDAPSRQNPKAAQWLHWLVVNVSGDEFIILLRIVAHWPAVNIICMYDVQ